MSSTSLTAIKRRMRGINSLSKATAYRKRTNIGSDRQNKVF